VFALGDGRRCQGKLRPIAEFEQPLLQDQRLDSIGKAGEVDVAATLKSVAGGVRPAIVARTESVVNPATGPAFRGGPGGTIDNLLRCGLSGLEAGN
jgi:hypothetical protein